MAVTIRKPWLDTVGGVKVERLDGVRRLRVSADLSRPAKGVLHTTEGSFESALTVFRSTGTPTFMVGRDRSGKLRVAQFMPIGEMSLTLTNPAGGVETNRWAHVQIEIVGFSQKTFGWPLGHNKQPMDEEVKKVIADLVRQASESAGIPLVHAGEGLTILGGATEAQRVSAWKTKAGWFAHSETPENASRHWDVGRFNWSDLLARARPRIRQVQFQLWALRDGRSTKIDQSSWANAPGKRRFALFYARVLPKVLAEVSTGRRPSFRRGTRTVLG